MSFVEQLERMSGGAWSERGCTHPHSLSCHAAFEPDCPKYADLTAHMNGGHEGWAIRCQREPCVSSPWFEHDTTSGGA